MSTDEEILEQPSTFHMKAAWDDLNTVSGHADDPPEILIRKDWLPVDPAQLFEAAVIAFVFVGGWFLALWVYVYFSR